MRVLPTGKVEVVTGTTPHGQGHETSWSMIVADCLGVPPEDVEVLHSDTAISHLGLDTYGSRSLSGRRHGAPPRVRQGRREGRARSPRTSWKSPRTTSSSSTGSSVSWARRRGRSRSRRSRSRRSPPTTCPTGWSRTCTADASYDPPNFTFPFGVHIAVVEIDAETGRVELQRYVAVDDCGNQINPLIVEGQMHGGHRAGQSRRRCGRRRVYDETATCAPRR